MYAFTGSVEFRDCDSFASVDGLGPLVGVAPQEYCTRTITVNDPSRLLEVPANLETLLDRFYLSSADDQDRFLRACFWFCHADTVFADSRSASYTALISAIEAYPISLTNLRRRPQGSGRPALNCTGSSGLGLLMAGPWLSRIAVRCLLSSPQAPSRIADCPGKFGGS